MLACPKMLLFIWTALVMSIPQSLQKSQQYTLYEIIINKEPLQYHKQGYQKEPLISAEEMEKCFKEHFNAASERNQLERRLVDEGKVISPNTKVTDISSIRRKRTDPFTRFMESKQLPFDRVTDDLIERHNLNYQQINEELPQQQFKGTYCDWARNNCTQPTSVGQCDSSYRYRTADGTCNNLNNPTWGSAGACFIRVLPPNYSGASGFRQSVRGGALPPPRQLSNNVHYNLNRPTTYVTHMYMFFGQLLDHDLVQTPFSTTVDNQAIQCCPESENSHPQCAPILIPSNDRFYSQFGTTCLNFVRSAVCPTCALGHRQQTNALTSFIDASFVYGNSRNETSSLRANDGTGRLRFQTTNSGGMLMPPSPDPRNDQCSNPAANEICFQAGDARANQHTTLTSLQTMFLREHNRLADGLRQINPSWDDERLFQEARRILGAQMQVITYKEYLPITLGQERMDYFKLWLSNRGSTNYDDNINPTLINEFSGAAFRFGHSLINSIISQDAVNGTNRLLRDDFFQPFGLYRGVLSPLLQGVTRSSAQQMDRHLVPDVRDYLYRIRGDPAGLDLASFNIQRGRDHGLPTYVQMVSFCSDNAYNVKQFKDLVNYGMMTYENAKLLQENYRSVDDIDLWTGAISEYPSDNDAVIGPTATCLVGLQFNRLKFGDRFYFEHRNQVGSFTYQQMEELRKVTLSKIMCLNSNIKQVALNAMVFGDRNNPLIYCPYVKGVNLSYWKE